MRNIPVVAYHAKNCARCHGGSKNWLCKVGYPWWHRNPVMTGIFWQLYQLLLFSWTLSTEISIQTEDLRCASCQFYVTRTRAHRCNRAKPGEPHWSTQANINTNTRLHALLGVSVSHSATCTYACNSETTAHLQGQ